MFHSSPRVPGQLSAPSPFDSISPYKQERPFASGSPGVTSWYTSVSYDEIPDPGPGLDPNVGDLYVHTNRSSDSYQIWLFDTSRNWKHLTNTTKVYHPTIADRVLSIRANGSPSWITAASYMTIKGRKEKTKTNM